MDANFSTFARSVAIYSVKLIDWYCAYCCCAQSPNKIREYVDEVYHESKDHICCAINYHHFGISFSLHLFSTRTCVVLFLIVFLHCIKVAQSLNLLVPLSESSFRVVKLWLHMILFCACCMTLYLSFKL